MAIILPATTSQRQGRLREEGSEGSPRQDLRADEQKRHTRLSLSGEPAQEGEALGSGGMVNGAVVQGQLTFLSGEICFACGEAATGDGLRTSSKGVESPPVPTVAFSARWSATARETEQKSAEAIVVALRPDRRVVKGRTSQNKEEP